MRKEIYLISLMLIIVNSVISVEIGSDTFKKLLPCEDKCNQLYSKQKANPVNEGTELKACKAGCNYNVIIGKFDESGCRKECEKDIKSESNIAACVKACTNFVVELPKIAEERPIVTEIKKIDDIKDLKDIIPAIPVKPKEDTIKQPPKVEDNKKKDSGEDVIENESSSSEEKSSEKKNSNSKSSSSSSEEQEQDIESPFEVFRHFFGSSLIGGEPGLQNQFENTITNEKKDDNLPSDLINIDDKLDQSNNPFDTLFNYFDKIREGLKTAYDKGSYILRVRIFPNGTVLKTYSQLPDTPQSIDSLFDQPQVDPIAIQPLDKQIDLHSPFGGNHNGQGINWKGIPMPIGKPIIEPYHPNEEPPFYYRFRECKPISFHFSTLCHDINNLFTCASMRTGLPRWFFLSAVLLTSFLLIWLGLFILASLRRLRRRERVILHREEYLPLYKDIDFEIEKSEINPAFDEAGPLPVKVKSDNIV